MKRIVLFDTSVGSLNHGDGIIMESFEKNAKDILDGNYISKFPTHTPCFTFCQQVKRNPRYNFVNDSDYKFICGTNLLNNRMYIPWPFFNINFFNSGCYKNSVLVGVGASAFPKGSNKVSLYSKLLFSKILSKEYKHSVRDERTKLIVDSILGEGSAINTGCPTIWGLTKEHCAKIPNKKAEEVILTLTDYSAKKEHDERLIEVLLKNYKKVYFWPQGTKDMEYFGTFCQTENITVISPGVKAYSEFLSEKDVDFVGTRLHAGIYAMQHKRRTVILSVDNRARDMAESYNLHVLDRASDKLEEKINSEFATDIKINEENIRTWKSQFKD